MSWTPSSSVNPADDLRALMLKHDLTQKVVAELASVSVKTVEGWLADKASVSHRTMHVRYMRMIRAFLPQHLAAKRGGKKAS